MFAIENPARVAAEREEAAYESLAAEFGWDAIERGEDPERFVSESDFEAADFADLMHEIAVMETIEADREGIYGFGRFTDEEIDMFN